MGPLRYVYYITDINPEPWAIGSLGVGRKSGKVYPYVGPNQQLKTYQLAIKEAMEDRGAVMLDVDSLRLSFYFWRRIEVYKNEKDRTNRKHEADATNLQKGLEDALQGVLFPNDRVVRDVRSQVIRQDSSVRPLVVVVVEAGYEPDLTDIPTEVWLALNQEPTLMTDNVNKVFETLKPEDVF